MLRIQDRLRDKLRVAQHAVGVAGHILPAAFAAPESPATTRGLAERSSLVDRRLREWAREAPPRAESTRPTVAVVASPVDGFIAAAGASGSARIVVDVGHGITDDTASHRSNSEPSRSRRRWRWMAVERLIISTTLERIAAFLQSRRAAESIDFAAAASARARRATLARVARAVARTPRHQALAHCAARRRRPRRRHRHRSARAPNGFSTSLVDAELPDEAWLRSIATFGALNARPAGAASARVSAEIVGVIVLTRSGNSIPRVAFPRSY